MTTSFDSFAEFYAAYPAVAIIGACLALAQVALLIVGVVTWWRDRSRAVAPLPRPAWLAVIVIVSIFGPVSYLVARRRRVLTDADDTAAGAASTRPSADETWDALYGRR